MPTLIGWKQIASHLQSGVRTVQRWESIGLPVHRPRGNKFSPVMAFSEELDAWSRATPRQHLDEIGRLRQQIASLEAENKELREFISGRGAKAGTT